jgi:hypothetical protein
MVPKLLTEGYKPVPRPTTPGGPGMGYQPERAGSRPSTPPPPPPPGTGSSVVKPQE